MIDGIYRYDGHDLKVTIYWSRYIGNDVMITMRAGDDPSACVSPNDVTVLRGVTLNVESADPDKWYRPSTNPDLVVATDDGQPPSNL